MRISNKQNLKDVRKLYGCIAAFDLRYDYFRDLCREVWKDEEYIYLYIDRSR